MRDALLIIEKTTLASVLLTDQGGVGEVSN